MYPCRLRSHKETVDSEKELFFLHVLHVLVCLSGVVTTAFVAKTIQAIAAQILEAQIVQAQAVQANAVQAQIP